MTQGSSKREETERMAMEPIEGLGGRNTRGWVGIGFGLLPHEHPIGSNDQ